MMSYTECLLRKNLIGSVVLFMKKVLSLLPTSALTRSLTRTFLLNVSALIQSVAVLHYNN